ncbi:hypothetical protein [Pseudomonas sp. NFX15]|uniref:hypothetical protein n=1 Tax=Pseudomonas sp. NFX15 TaxID=2816958 RepID=UPI003B8CD8B9
MKKIQLTDNSGGNMRKAIKNTSSRKRSPAVGNKDIALALTASERRLLQLIATGIEDEPAGILAGASYKFSS